MANEYNGWNQEQLVSGIRECEAEAEKHFEERSKAEKAGRAANKKVENMRKALTELLLNPSKKPGK